MQPVLVLVLLLPMMGVAKLQVQLGLRSWKGLLPLNRLCLALPLSVYWLAQPCAKADLAPLLLELELEVLAVPAQAVPGLELQIWMIPLSRAGMLSLVLPLLLLYSFVFYCPCDPALSNAIQGQFGVNRCCKYESVRPKDRAVHFARDLPEQTCLLQQSTLDPTCADSSNTYKSETVTDESSICMLASCSSSQQSTLLNFMDFYTQPDPFIESIPGFLADGEYENTQLEPSGWSTTLANRHLRCLAF